MIVSRSSKGGAASLPFWERGQRPRLDQKLRQIFVYQQYHLAVAQKLEHLNVDDPHAPCLAVRSAIPPKRP